MFEKFDNGQDIEEFQWNVMPLIITSLNDRIKWITRHMYQCEYRQKKHFWTIEYVST